MPARRELTMRQIRHMLRLARDGVSAREIGRTLGIARSTVQDNLGRAAAAGLLWPLGEEITDAVLRKRLGGGENMGQISVEKSAPPGSDLSGNQQPDARKRQDVGKEPATAEVAPFV